MDYLIESYSEIAPVKIMKDFATFTTGGLRYIIDYGNENTEAKHWFYIREECFGKNVFGESNVKKEELYQLILPKSMNDTNSLNDSEHGCRMLIFEWSDMEDCSERSEKNK